MALSAEMILTLQQLDGFGTKTIFKIAQQISTPPSSLKELYDFLKTLKGKRIQSISLEDIIDANDIAKKIIDVSSKHFIDFVGYYDSDFPTMLRTTINEDGKLDPPMLLWYRGNLSVTSMPGLAVIGTREPTPDGVAGGTYLSGEFAKRKLNIISGLAVGCDSAGHIGALKVGGITTAILANGLDTNSIYPTENKELAETIVEQGGLLLSEYPVGQGVKSYALVARDRLQAALSKATLVIQTGIKGGTMHAANTTLVSKKPLYAMKFKDSITNNHEKCMGNAYLVSQGATFISGNDNIDQIASSIINHKSTSKTLFD
ncbi:MAG: DNA-processing protein DprA [Bacteroidales bacterium]|nr:DNA-processing protein DprA [Bacteroidales bacterium]MDY2705888.1 DNA-processing protein DprA [Alloprevotella sp.]